MKKLLITLALSTVLATTVKATDELGDSNPRALITQRQGKYTVDEQITDKWWGDYESSGEKSLVRYVHNLGNLKTPDTQEAALWFLLTGGKYGFSKRTATSEEKEMMVSSLKKVTKDLYEKGQAIEEFRLWKKVTKKCPEGKRRVKILYQMVDDLKLEILENLAKVQKELLQSFNDELANHKKIEEDYKKTVEQENMRIDEYLAERSKKQERIFEDILKKFID